MGNENIMKHLESRRNRKDRDTRRNEMRRRKI